MTIRLEDALENLGVLKIALLGGIALFFWNIAVSPWWVVL